MSKESQYEKYWLLLLTDGKLTIQIPTSLVITIKKAIIVRKYAHRMRSGIKFNKLRCLLEPAKDATGKLLPLKTQVTFFLHNLTEKDI